MLLILGSIVDTSLKNMYVRKPIKEEYTFETDKSTKLLLSQCVQMTLPNPLQCMESPNPKFSFYGGTNECAKTNTLLLPLS